MNTTTANSTISVPVHEWATNLDGAPLGVEDVASEYAEPVATLAVGDRGYLVEHIDTNTGRIWWMQDGPGRTNRSNEPLAEGWLGSTNNVSMYGRGFVEVVHIGPRVIRVRTVDLVEESGVEMSPDEQLAELGLAAARAQAERDAAFARLRAAVLAAVQGGMPEAAAARAAGVDRMTVRQWRAKQATANPPQT